MKTRDFSFNLPDHLIAQEPPAERGSCRLMTVGRSSGSIEHKRMADIVDLIPAGAEMVFNNSKVRKARLFATRPSGSSVEFLLVERLDAFRWRAIVSKSRKQRPGAHYDFPGGVEAEIETKEPPYRIVRTSEEIDDEYLDRHGHVPLPPYIRRADSASDVDRYQTVYARSVGSAAAPTAGLHFTGSLIDELRSKGVGIHFVTLHVGLGTFAPIRGESIETHVMHEERYEIPESTATAVARAIEENRRVVAVGTTSVRCLESAWNDGAVRPGCGRTSLYIQPGYEWKTVDAMVTNFHTPESTLLVMVSAFAGVESIRRAYAAAIDEGYQFFSYGDAMVIL